jgi:hypothetical protein
MRLADAQNRFVTNSKQPVQAHTKRPTEFVAQSSFHSSSKQERIKREEMLQEETSAKGVAKTSATPAAQ